MILEMSHHNDDPSEKEPSPLKNIKETKIAIEESNEEAKGNGPCFSHQTDSHHDCKIDNLFGRISYFCEILGVNFYRDRCSQIRILLMVIIAVVCIINVYFVGYVSFLIFTKKFNAEKVATSISRCTWVIQATMSTIFLAWWQYTGQPSKLLKLLREAQQGVGIQHYGKHLKRIVVTFYIVVAFLIAYYVVLIIANFLDVKVGYMDMDIVLMVFGKRHLFVIVQSSILYCTLCWSVALFLYSLLIHSTHYEFLFYNEQVRTIQCSSENQSDEELCNYLLQLMKIHNRLIECVQCLDKMFHRYAFVMIATNIPTTMFTMFMSVHSPQNSFCWEFFFSFPLVIFCVFTFFALVNGPSQLHDTVYHSALAFICHLDQTNLGVSIWGFAVVSKKLVLTTISVMVTCLAFFLQVGDCSAGTTSVASSTMRTPL